MWKMIGKVLSARVCRKPLEGENWSLNPRSQKLVKFRRKRDGFLSAIDFLERERREL